MDIQADRQTTDSLIPIFLHSGKLKNAVPFDIKRAGNGIFKPSILFFTGLILKAAFFQFYVFKALGFFSKRTMVSVFLCTNYVRGF